jgi:hypothetical protein
MTPATPQTPGVREAMKQDDGLTFSSHLDLDTYTVKSTRT